MSYGCCYSHPCLIPLDQFRRRLAASAQPAHPLASRRTPMASAPQRTPHMVGRSEEPPVRCVCACVHDANGVVMVVQT